MGFFLFEGDDVSFFSGGENFVFSAFVFVKGAVPDKDRWFFGKVKTSFHEKRVRHVGFGIFYIFLPLFAAALSKGGKYRKMTALFCFPYTFKIFSKLFSGAT